MTPLPRLTALALMALAACNGTVEVSTDGALGATSSATGPLPLTDMGSTTYKGFAGGLYPGGNAPPQAHHDAGVTAARRIVPRDVNGNAVSTGKYVLVSIGMSNTTQEFCSQGGGLPCNAWTFMGQAASDASVNHTRLAIVNGALGGQVAESWDQPTDANYDRVRDQVLAPQGLGEKQVQVAWVKVAHANPTTALPDANADAYLLERDMGNMVRALKTRYPNLQQVFFTSRIYAGYATTTLNPEPYAYESGFAVKWLVQAQIDQVRTGVVDARAGNLDYRTGAPWIAWGPYPWANGLTPRSDGLTWDRSEFESDGTHPAQPAERKVGTMLLTHFKNSDFTRCWFVAGQSC
ncbi:MAG TPA: hypothetical protein VFJ82_24440 [Longimicrobium sp.]|nr:hypothetical protein [Longimicrobium sp.]